MAYNFRRANRDQSFLLPPDLRDWLPADHLAWFVLDVVDQLDLGPFLRGYRADGHGHPAYDPKMLLGVLLYTYATGVRSSRQVGDLRRSAPPRPETRSAGRARQRRSTLGGHATPCSQSQFGQDR